MANVRLTKGFIGSQVFWCSIPEAQKLLETLPPTNVQVLSLKKVGEPDKPRYRLIISDGEHYAHAMLHASQNNLVERQYLGKFSVISILKMTAGDRPASDCHNLFVIEDARLIPGQSEKLGSPQRLLQDASDTSMQADDIPTPITQSPARPQARTQTSVAGGSSARASISTIARAPESPRKVYSIDSLHPFLNKFTVKAAVIHKADIQTFQKGSSQGKRLQITIKDDTGVIRATAWNEDADRFFGILQSENVYYISNARISNANKRFNPTHDCELTFDKSTVVEECPGSRLERSNLRVTPLGDLSKLGKDSTCDVIGILTDVSAIKDINFGDRKTKVREVTILDQSGSTRVSLWAKKAEDFAIGLDSVLLFKQVKAKEYNGVHSLSMSSMSTMEVNPENKAAQDLRQWYDIEGSFAKLNLGLEESDEFNYGAVQCLHDVKEAGLGQKDKEEPFSIQATITSVKAIADGKFAYPSCRSETCLRKVARTGGEWRCSACNKSWDKPLYRYVFPIYVADLSDVASLTAFDGPGQTLLGMTADELTELKEHDEDRFLAVVEGLIGKSYNFMCKAKQDVWQDRVQIRYAIDKVFPRNYKRDTYYLKALFAAL